MQHCSRADVGRERSIRYGTGLSLVVRFLSTAHLRDHWFVECQTVTSKRPPCKAVTAPCCQVFSDKGHESHCENLCCNDSMYFVKMTMLTC